MPSHHIQIYFIKVKRNFPYMELILLHVYLFMLVTPINYFDENQKDQFERLR